MALDDMVREHAFCDRMLPTGNLFMQGFNEGENPKAVASCK